MSGEISSNRTNRDVTKTIFKVHSQDKHERSWSATLIPISILLGCLYRLDPSIEMDLLWVLSGAGIAVYVFETSSRTRDVEVSLTVCPLGVQRTTSTHRNRPVRHHPFLPKESIRDCIVTEHVGAFSVSSHVMLRLGDTTDCGGPALIPAFPKATLSFGQCHVLMKQIQRALRDT